MKHPSTGSNFVPPASLAQSANIASTTPEPVSLNPITLATKSMVPSQPSSQSRSIFREYILPGLLLSISMVTTTAIGARYMQNFLDGLPTVVSENDLWPWPWLISDPRRFALGWPFSLTLLTILVSHELGHYFACRHHRVRCTLPIVLPAPTLSGTAGAVIQIRGRIPDRDALMNVGIYGPIAGYIVSFIAVAAGLILSRPGNAGHTNSLLEFGQPLTVRILHGIIYLFDRSSPPFNSALRHPILIAGWVGLFITALNLIPGGQLDGGHILYSISPRLHRSVTRILPVTLIICGFFFWVGWILWGVILWLPAMRHPNVPETYPLNPKRFLLGLVALVLFILALSPAPFEASSILHYLPPLKFH